MIINIDENIALSGILELRNSTNPIIQDFVAEIERELKTGYLIESENDIYFSDYFGNEETLRKSCPCPVCED